MIGDRWGVTDAETTRWFPCDDFVPDPVLQAWRGVTVRARAEHVWPRVAQIRLGPYSYDWIDNLGRRSPRDLRGLPEPVVGQSFTAALGGRRAGRIVAVESCEHLTATIMGAVMSYVLVPIDDGVQTRLLLKVVTAGGRVIAPLLSVGDLIMARTAVAQSGGAGRADCNNLTDTRSYRQTPRSRATRLGTPLIGH